VSAGTQIRIAGDLANTHGREAPEIVTPNFGNEEGLIHVLACTQHAIGVGHVVNLHFCRCGYELPST